MDFDSYVVLLLIVMAVVFLFVEAVRQSNDKH